MRPRHQLVPALVPAAALLAGCAANGGGQDESTSDPSAKGVTTVVAKQIRFSPAAIEVPVGTEVTWSFQDGLVSHDFEGDGRGSGDPQRSGTLSRAFDQPGTHDYACTLHPQMTGRVVVTATP
jgi:plastocyanin